MSILLHEFDLLIIEATGENLLRTLGEATMCFLVGELTVGIFFIFLAYK
jgi:hypothetical protein